MGRKVNSKNLPPKTNERQGIFAKRTNATKSPPICTRASLDLRRPFKIGSPKLNARKHCKTSTTFQTGVASTSSLSIEIKTIRGQTPRHTQVVNALVLNSNANMTPNHDDFYYVPTTPPARE